MGRIKGKNHGEPVAEDTSMFRLKYIVTSLLTVSLFCCNNPFTPREEKIDVGGSNVAGILPAIEPEAVLSNFQYIYNFCQNGFNVETAIELYRNCFSNDINGPQYEFKYWDVIGGSVSGTPGGMFYDEEMASTANLFREVDQKKLNLYLKTFNKKSNWVETAEDTVAQARKHPGEDWYVYEMNAYMTMENPDPAEYPFLVQGKGLFCIRRCTDGFYRIVWWVDMTYEGLTQNPKSNGTFFSFR